MKKLSLVSITAAFISIGTVAIAPAKATNLTRVDYTGNFTIQLPLPTTSQQVSGSQIVDNLSGRLSDAGDAELTIDKPFSLSPKFQDLLDSFLIKINAWEGTGSIFNQQGLLSDFNFNYNKDSDILTIKDYDFASIKVCLDSTCNLKGKGKVSGSSPLLGNFNKELKFDLNQTATPLYDVDTLAEVPDLTPLALPSATQSVPEPSLLLGLIGLGGVFVAKPKQQKSV